MTYRICHHNLFSFQPMCFIFSKSQDSYFSGSESYSDDDLQGGGGKANQKSFDLLRPFGQHRSGAFIYRLMDFSVIYAFILNAALFYYGEHSMKNVALFDWHINENLMMLYLIYTQIQMEKLQLVTANPF